MIDAVAVLWEADESLDTTRKATASAVALKAGAGAQNRTGDTRIFSPVLYHLSYPGT